MQCSALVIMPCKGTRLLFKCTLAYTCNQLCYCQLHCLCSTGVVLIRNTAAAVQAMSAWRDAMAPGSANKSAEGWWIDDQLALTQLLDASSLPFQEVEGSSRTTNTTTAAGSSIQLSERAALPQPANSSFTSAATLWTWRHKLKVVALPPLVVAGGHVAFHQRLPEVHGIVPHAVHFTFQAKHDNEGKLSRVRESNLWLMDPLEPQGATYLTYANMVDSWITAVDLVWQQHTGAKLAEMHKHLLAAGELTASRSGNRKGSRNFKQGMCRACTILTTTLQANLAATDCCPVVAWLTIRQHCYSSVSQSIHASNACLPGLLHLSPLPKTTTCSLPTSGFG